MSRSNRVCLAGILSFCALLTAPVRGDEGDDARKIATALKSVATRLDELASFEELGTEIPLTSLTPSDALRLGELFRDSLFEAMDTASGDAALTFATLKSAIENAGHTFPGTCSTTSSKACTTDGDCETGEVCEGVLTIGFSNATVVSDGGTPPKINIGFDVGATRTLLESVGFVDADRGIRLGGEFSLTVTLSSKLDFQFNPAEGDPEQAFALRTDLPEKPRIDVTVEATAASVGDLGGLVGIADVTVSGTVDLDIDIRIEFDDPDGTGLLTISELKNTSYADLVTVEFLEEAGDEVRIELKLDADLIGGFGVDGSIEFVDDNLADGVDGIASPIFKLNSLPDFSNVTPTQILSGLSSLAACIGGIERLSDFELPFLQVRFGDTYDLAKPVVDLIRQQVDASIICGTIDDIPPRGDFIHLPKDAEFFCQAIALNVPAEVVWKDTSNVTVVARATDLDTVGIAPTQNVKLKMTAAGKPDVRFRFRNDLLPETPFRPVSRVFLTAADLFQKIVGDEISPLSTPPFYDAATKTLTYHIVKSFDPGAFGDDASRDERVNLDFSDQLKEKTRLAGISTSGGVTIDPGVITMAVTFGIILVDDVAKITPGSPDPPSDLDRFFIQVDAAAPELAVEDVSVTVKDFKLTGRFGFLAVSVEGDGTANPTANKVAFEIGAADTSKPLLAVDVNGGDIVVTGATTILNAILLTDMLENLATSIDVRLNVKMSGGLKVTAEGITPLTDATASIKINWPNMFTGTWPNLQLTTPVFDGTFDKFSLFDTDPSLFGKHRGAGAANDAVSLTDDQTDFAAQGKARGRTLRNLTDGSSCVVTEVVGTDVLVCALAGGTKNLWDIDDKYELIGNPFDLLSVILDNFDDIVKGIDALTGTGLGNVFSDKLPLVGVSPEDILAFVGDLESAVDKIRAGEPEAMLVCTWNPKGAGLERCSGGDKDGEPCTADSNCNTVDPAAVCKLIQPDDALVGLPPEGKRCADSPVTLCDVNEDCPTGVCSLFKAEVSCQAFLGTLENGNAVKSVEWTLVDLAATAPPVPNATNSPGVTTVGLSPTTFAEFDVPGGGTLGRDFKITVKYTTNKGTCRGELPEEPMSLQALGRALENNLGLPESAVTLELIDLPKPGETAPDGIKDLVIRLAFAECTDSTCVGGDADGEVCGTGIPCPGGTCVANPPAAEGGIDCTTAQGRIVPRKSVEFSLGLDDKVSPDLEGFVGIDSGIQLMYRASANLDLAIPLDTTFDSSAIVVVDTSGITLDLRAAITSEFMVSAGPGELKAVGEAKIGAQFNLLPCQTGDPGCTSGLDATPNNQTQTIAKFVESLALSFGDGTAPLVACDKVTIAKVMTGQHDGDDGAFGVKHVGCTTPPCSVVDGCGNDPTVACPNEAIGSGQVGATLRKLDAAREDIEKECTATDFIDDQLMCLLAGTQLKKCSGGGADCTASGTCPEGETCDNAACDGATPCPAGELCVSGACKKPEFLWDKNHEYEILDSTPGVEVILGGEACAKYTLSLAVDGLGEVPVGVLAFKADKLSEPDDLNTVDKWYAHASLDSQSALQVLKSLDLDLALLFKAFRFLIDQLGNILEGGGPKLDLPIIGQRLDGGSGVCMVLDDGNCGGLAGVLDTLEGLLTDAATFEEVRNLIQVGTKDDTGTGGLFGFLDGPGLLLPNGFGADDAVAEKDDIVVEFECGGTPPMCDETSDSLADVEDIRIRFLMGQGNPGTGLGCTGPEADCKKPLVEENIDFSLGIPGVPLGISDTKLTVNAGWRFLIDFGLNRKSGPYIVSGGSGHESDPSSTDTNLPELVIGASVTLDGTGNCGGPIGITDLDTRYAASNCIQAELAFLDATLRNPKVDPTGLELSTTLDVQASGTDKIGLCALTNGKASLILEIKGDARVDYLFRTEFAGANAQLPNVIGTFHLDWVDKANPTNPGFSLILNTSGGERADLDIGKLEVKFEDLYLDVGTFISKFVEPMVKNIRKATKPLAPVIDTVRAPIPVVSKLSELTGGPKVTLLSLMELANGGKRIPMIRNLIDLIAFINEIGADPSIPPIPLGGSTGGTVAAAAANMPGSFVVDKEKARKGKSTPDKAGGLVKSTPNGTNKQITSKVKTTTTKTPSSLSFPFLQDSSQIFGLLLGQDVTLMRFDAGEMRATATVGPFTYCCIPVGPIPVSVFIEGSATLKGRFAMGYDTVGLRKAFARKEITGGTAIDLLDGVFIDDLDAQGRDVPEITLIGTVRAGAGIDLFIAAVGVEGGIELTVDFNLDDRPEPDGKLRLDEVINRLSNPICLFEVKGKLEAFLGAWARVGFEWFSKTWRIELARITLLEFSAACTPPAPMPATADNHTLHVNIGPRASRRNFNVDEEQETVILRQLTRPDANGRATISVSLMGFVEEYTGISRVVVDGGTDNDIISLLEGTKRVKKSACTAPAILLRMCTGTGTDRPCTVATEAEDCDAGDQCLEPPGDPNTLVECIYPFTVPGTISGGKGDDQINGGSGNDILNGNDGNDKITGGDGDDTINGGKNDDVLAGDRGNDTIHGGSGNDSITGGPDNCPGLATGTPVCQGPGNAFGDLLFGDSGDDDINGGPGTNGNEGRNPNPDGNDMIVGGPGRDILQGFFGDDTIYGDGIVLCSDSTVIAGDDMDKIDGGPGDDTLIGGGGDDTISGEEGNDKICGNAGNDMLEGDALDATALESGDDDIFGGDGHDQLFGRFGHDLLFGGAGNDALFGDEGPDDLIGGGGRDVLIGGAGVDILLGDGRMNADDLSDPDNSILNHDTHNHDDPVATLLADVTTDDERVSPEGECAPGKVDCDAEVLSCDIGRDFFVSPIEPLFECNSSSDCVDAGKGRFCILVIGMRCGGTVSGKPCLSSDECGASECESLPSVRNACANEVGPMLVGIKNQSNATPEANSDCLFGGDSGDLLFGEGGHDRMFGDGAQGECVATDGSTDDDYMEGNTGNDLMRGGMGNDTMFGNGGADRMFGDSGNDEMFGCDLETDNCHGLADVDTMRGGKGNDYMEGNQDGDFMFGDAGEDNMIGGSGCPSQRDGADTMFGNRGEDVMIGDNGTIGVIGTTCGAWKIGDNTTIISRVVKLFDLTCGAGLGGNDVMNGNSEDDDMYGGCATDTMHGDAGDDYMEGNPGIDTMHGDDGQDDMIGGTSQGGGTVADAGDFMHGDAGQDVMIGDNGSITRPGGAAPVDGTIHRTVTLFDLACSNGAFAGSDTMNGNGHNDDMYGGCENDTMHGNAGDDYMEGNGDDNAVEGDGDGDVGDLMFGDLGQDDMIGGTSQRDESAPPPQDGGDTMWGGNGSETTADIVGSPNAIHDVLVGDNATITRPTQTVGTETHWIEDDFVPGDTEGVIRRVVTLFDVAEVNKPVPANTSGADHIHGELGRDLIYGGGDNDKLHGNEGHDYVEGNAGDDVMWGDQGQDDLIGGTGRTTSDTDSTAVSGRLDGGDTIYGGDNVADIEEDYDVIIGDNGTIDRQVDASGAWIKNDFNNAFRRRPRLLDIGTVSAAAGANTSGVDTIYGEGNDDVLFGQGSGDFMFGGTGEDYMEGNEGDDWMEGNEESDDMVGGTGRIDVNGLFIAADDEMIETKGVDGRLDGADTMLGNDGFDVMAGDNALIVRRLILGKWELNSFNGGTQHLPRVLLDIDGAPLTSGGDTMFGGHAPELVAPSVACASTDDCGAEECCFDGFCAFEGLAALPDKDDLMYGQGGNDCMFGNDGDDFMEGNAGRDRMRGGADQDDMIGGTVQAGVTDLTDEMFGNDADDVMIGDNGNILRPLITDATDPNVGKWVPDPNTMAVVRDVFLFDVQTVGSSVSAAFSGGDVMWGNDGNDRMYGQGGVDEMHGGANFDIMEGNHAGDVMFGDGGEDDMIGGGSANDGVIRDDSVADGLLDDEDEMHGGDEGDVMAGDNARITRLTDDMDKWKKDPNSDDVLRQMVLFDVEIVDGLVIDEDTSGSDRMFGDAGRDLMFGQGNTQIDSDGDGRFNEDPADGRDNDRDGREGVDSVVYDCEDREDNEDADTDVDGADAECVAAIDEDGGGDEMHGGTGVDYMEGNHGSDWMFGDEGEDDMIGGGSANDGVIGGGAPPTDLRDGDDTMSGGDEDDVMLGDNGQIVRSVEPSGIWKKHLSQQVGLFDLVIRVVTMDHVPEKAGAFGHDFMLGNDGHDDMYGQLGDDFMEGNDGEDAMVGDLGQITGTVEDGSRQRDIMIPAPFLEDTLFELDTFTRSVELFSFRTGEGGEGNDIMLGSDGRDSMHGGPGNDFMNGDGDGDLAAAEADPDHDPNPATDDEDHVFGGDGDDVMWGGRHHDHLWGGHGDDHIDVRPRTATVVTAPDNALWFTYGRPDNFQDLDIIYGGFDRDAMQANEAEAGPPLADRLIDWVGGFNVFYVCPGAYGEGTITRIPSPDMQDFLRDLSEGDGAFMPRIEGTSGFRELGYVFPKDMRLNAKPPHPDHPGHFVCPDGTVRFKSNEVTGRALQPGKKIRASSRSGGDTSGE